MVLTNQTYNTQETLKSKPNKTKLTMVQSPLQYPARKRIESIVIKNHSSRSSEPSLSKSTSNLVNVITMLSPTCRTLSRSLGQIARKQKYCGCCVCTMWCVVCVQDCCICCDSLKEVSGYGGSDEHVVVQLYKCSHMFHLDCIAAMYDSGTKVCRPADACLLFVVFYDSVIFVYAISHHHPHYHFWPAPLRLHSTTRYQQPPERAILSHTNCFSRRELVGLKII